MLPTPLESYSSNTLICYLDTTSINSRIYRTQSTSRCLTTKHCTQAIFYLPSGWWTATLRTEEPKPTSRSVLSDADRGSPPTNTSVPFAPRRSAHSHNTTHEKKKSPSQSIRNNTASSIKHSLTWLVEVAPRRRHLILKQRRRTGHGLCRRNPH
jgi:hypothetical protein